MAIGKKALLRGYPKEGYEGGITFAGLTYEIFDDKEYQIDENWNEDSWDTNVNYINRLIENLNMNKPLRKMDDRDIRDLHNRLSKRDDEGYAYATLNNIGYWYYRIYKEGVRRGYYEDATFCADYYSPSGSGTDFMVRVKKSFTVSEEQRIFLALYKKPEEISGEDLGLLLMFLLAFRENEVCALDYKDIREMKEYPGNACVWVYETTMINTSKRKAGGKTKNASRVIPLYDFLYVYLMKRKTYLEALVESGKLVLKSEYKCVDDLPIVCIGKNYNEKSPTKYLIRRGNELFKELKIEGVSLSELFKDISSGDLDDVGVMEKEPTTYIFRRNRGTSLYNIGMEMYQIQYFMGHEIEDPYYCRNVVTNERELIKIKHKLDSLPVNGFLNGHLDNHNTNLIRKNNSHYREEIQTNEDCEKLKIKINGNEPGDNIYVVLKSLEGIDVSVEYNTEDIKYGRQVNIVSSINGAYKFCDESMV